MEQPAFPHIWGFSHWPAYSPSGQWRVWGEDTQFAGALKTSVRHRERQASLGASPSIWFCFLSQQLCSLFFFLLRVFEIWRKHQWPLHPRILPFPGKIHLFSLSQGFDYRTQVTLPWIWVKGIHWGSKWGNRAGGLKNIHISLLNLWHVFFALDPSYQYLCISILKFLPFYLNFTYPFTTTLCPNSLLCQNFLKMFFIFPLSFPPPRVSTHSDVLAPAPPTPWPNTHTSWKHSP